GPGRDAAPADRRALSGLRRSRLDRGIARSAARHDRRGDRRRPVPTFARAGRRGKGRIVTAPLRSGDPIVVDVALGSRAYDIVIGRGLLSSLGARIAGLRPGCKAAIVTDESVAR